MLRKRVWKYGDFRVRSSL